MPKIILNNIWQIVSGVLGTAIVVGSLLIASSKSAGVDSNQLRITTDNVEKVMTIQLPNMDRRVGVLEQEMSASKMDRENIKKVMDRMDSRIEKMFERQFPQGKNRIIPSR